MSHQIKDKSPCLPVECGHWCPLFQEVVMSETIGGKPDYLSIHLKCAGETTIFIRVEDLRCKQEGIAGV